MKRFKRIVLYLCCLAMMLSTAVGLASSTQVKADGVSTINSGISASSADTFAYFQSISGYLMFVYSGTEDFMSFQRTTEDIFCENLSTAEYNRGDLIDIYKPRRDANQAIEAASAWAKIKENPLKYSVDGELKTYNSFRSSLNAEQMFQYDQSYMTANSEWYEFIYRTITSGENAIFVSEVGDGSITLSGSNSKLYVGSTKAPTDNTWYYEKVTKLKCVNWNKANEVFNKIIKEYNKNVPKRSSDDVETLEELTGSHKLRAPHSSYPDIAETNAAIFNDLGTIIADTKTRGKDSDDDSYGYSIFFTKFRDEFWGSGETKPNLNIDDFGYWLVVVPVQLSVNVNKTSKVFKATEGGTVVGDLPKQSGSNTGALVMNPGCIFNIDWLTKTPYTESWTGGYNSAWTQSYHDTPTYKAPASVQNLDAGRIWGNSYNAGIKAYQNLTSNSTGYGIGNASTFLIRLAESLYQINVGVGAGEVREAGFKPFYNLLGDGKGSYAWSVWDYDVPEDPGHDITDPETGEVVGHYDGHPGYSVYKQGSTDYTWRYDNWAFDGTKTYPRVSKSEKYVMSYYKSTLKAKIKDHDNSTYVSRTPAYGIGYGVFGPTTKELGTDEDQIYRNGITVQFLDYASLNDFNAYKSQKIKARDTMKTVGRTNAHKTGEAVSFASATFNAYTNSVLKQNWVGMAELFSLMGKSEKEYDSRLGVYKFKGAKNTYSNLTWDRSHSSKLDDLILFTDDVSNITTLRTDLFEEALSAYTSALKDAGYITTIDVFYSQAHQYEGANGYIGSYAATSRGTLNGLVGSTPILKSYSVDDISDLFTTYKKYTVNTTLSDSAERLAKNYSRIYEATEAQIAAEGLLSGSPSKAAKQKQYFAERCIGQAFTYDFTPTYQTSVGEGELTSDSVFSYTSTNGKTSHSTVDMLEYDGLTGQMKISESAEPVLSRSYCTESSDIDTLVSLMTFTQPVDEAVANENAKADYVGLNTAKYKWLDNYFGMRYQKKTATGSDYSSAKSTNTPITSYYIYPSVAVYSYLHSIDIITDESNKVTDVKVVPVGDEMFYSISSPEVVECSEGYEYLIAIPRATRDQGDAGVGAKVDYSSFIGQPAFEDADKTAIINALFDPSSITDDVQDNIVVRDLSTAKEYWAGCFTTGVKGDDETDDFIFTGYDFYQIRIARSFDETAVPLTLDAMNLVEVNPVGRTDSEVTVLSSATATKESGDSHNTFTKNLLGTTAYNGTGAFYALARNGSNGLAFGGSWSAGLIQWRGIMNRADQASYKPVISSLTQPMGAGSDSYIIDDGYFVLTEDMLRGFGYTTGTNPNVTLADSDENKLESKSGNKIQYKFTGSMRDKSGSPISEFNIGFRSKVYTFTPKTLEIPETEEKKGMVSNPNIAVVKGIKDLYFYPEVPMTVQVVGAARLVPVVEGARPRWYKGKDTFESAQDFIENVMFDENRPLYEETKTSGSYTNYRYWAQPHYVSYPDGGGYTWWSQESSSSSYSYDKYNRTLTYEGYLVGDFSDNSGVASDTSPWSSYARSGEGQLGRTAGTIDVDGGKARRKDLEERIINYLQGKGMTIEEEAYVNATKKHTAVASEEANLLNIVSQDVLTMGVRKRGVKSTYLIDGTYDREAAADDRPGMLMSDTMVTQSGSNVPRLYVGSDFTLVSKQQDKKINVNADFYCLSVLDPSDTNIHGMSYRGVPSTQLQGNKRKASYSNAINTNRLLTQNIATGLSSTRTSIIGTKSSSIGWVTDISGGSRTDRWIEANAWGRNGAWNTFYYTYGNAAKQWFELIWNNDVIDKYEAASGGSDDRKHIPTYTANEVFANPTGISSWNDEDYKTFIEDDLRLLLNEQSLDHAVVELKFTYRNDNTGAVVRTDSIKYDIDVNMRDDDIVQTYTWDANNEVWQIYTNDGENYYLPDDTDSTVDNGVLKQYFNSWGVGKTIANATLHHPTECAKYNEIVRTLCVRRVHVNSQQNITLGDILVEDKIPYGYMPSKGCHADCTWVVHAYDNTNKEIRTFNITGADFILLYGTSEDM